MGVGNVDLRVWRVAGGSTVLSACRLPLGSALGVWTAQSWVEKGLLGGAVCLGKVLGIELCIFSF